MLPLELLREVISVEDESFSDECFPPLMASKQEQQAPIVAYYFVDSITVGLQCLAPRHLWI